MVKRGNAPVPNAHFHKHWHPSASQKGRVRVYFDTAPQKRIRRLRRMKRAKQIFPRPIRGPLRPIVHCPTQRYNMKTRRGKGFTIMELKNAGIKDPKFARTIGIAVDKRRRNHSEESLALNTERLKEYMGKMVLFPLKPKKVKKGKVRGVVSECDAAKMKELSNRGVYLDKRGRAYMPKPKQVGKDLLKAEEPRKLTDVEKKRAVVNFLRKVTRDKKSIGKRLKRQAKKEAKANKEAMKK